MKDSIIIAAFYQFADWPEYKSWRKPLRDVGEAHGVRGSVLLAAEGINGTIAGPRAGVNTVLAFIRQDGRFATMHHKESTADFIPFGKMRVRLKQEIVHLGIDGINPNDEVGTYVPPSQWNDLISDPDVVLIDTRNNFEVELGSFQGALNPRTEAFNHFPEYVATHLDPAKNKKVAMFCTGGIRCEKATAYLRQQGFEEVYHLQGGILNYLAQVPAEQSLWEGECFVFDDRVSVNHALEPTFAELCYYCQSPITDADRQSPHYRKSIHCPRCYDKMPPEQIARAERKLENQAHQGEKRPFAPT